MFGQANAARTISLDGLQVGLNVMANNISWLIGERTNNKLGIALYILLWPQDGKMHKEDILGVFDGTTFYRIAEQHAKGR